MAPVHTLPRSALAAMAFTSSYGSHIWLYYQDTVGNIRSSIYNPRTTPTWSSGTIIGKAKFYTGIACTCCKSGIDVRVYYINEDNQIVERLFAAGPAEWVDGPLNHNSLEVSKNLQLSCTRSNNKVHLFYQCDENNIREMVYASSKWTQTQEISPRLACPGASFTTCSRSSGEIWLYYQQPDETFVEYIRLWGLKHLFKGSYTAESAREFMAGASISAVVWASDKVHIRIVTVDGNGELHVRRYDGDPTTWKDAEKWTTGIAGSSSVSIDMEYGAAGTLGRDLRLFYQPAPNVIAEYGTKDGVEWELREANIPTCGEEWEK